MRFQRAALEFMGTQVESGSLEISEKEKGS